MSYDIETIDPKDYSDLEIRDLMTNGLRAQYNDGSADDFINQVDSDTDFYTEYMSDKLLIVMREGSPKNISAYMLLTLVPFNSRADYPLYVPGNGFAYISQANLVGSGPEELSPKEAMLKFFDVAEKDLEIMSEHEKEMGRRTYDSIVTMLNRNDWKLSIMGPGQFLSYDWKFVLPYSRKEECDPRKLLEEHPVRISDVDGEILKLMHLHINKDVIEKLSYPENIKDMRYYVFEKDDCEALVTIPDNDIDPQFIHGIPSIEINRMVLRDYDFDQDNNFGKDDSFVPRTIACIERIGEYVCREQSIPNLAIVYTGSEMDVSVIGQEYVSSIVFIRSLKTMN